MTDNEIIKELQCASEWFTKHGRNTNTAVIGICDRAVDLINRQKAEIEWLKGEMDKQYETAEASIRAEIASGGTSCHWCENTIKARAIKEYAERLKKTPIKCTYPLLGLLTKEEIKEHYYDILLQVGYEIDNLAKEMIGAQE